MRALRVVLEVSGVILDHFGSPGRHLEGLWESFGRPSGVFGWPWGAFGEVLGLIWEALGIISEASGTIFDVSEQEAQFSRKPRNSLCFSLNLRVRGVTSRAWEATFGGFW
jgi:hypothetical protein